MIKAARGAEAALTLAVKTTLTRLGLRARGPTKVFPEVTHGNRARLFTLDVEDATPRDRVRALLEALRSDPSVEYAEKPSPKRPVG